MANVIACVLGGTPRRLTASSVGDVKRQMGLSTPHAAVINGETQADAYSDLEDEDFISLSPQVKGGRVGRLVRLSLAA